MDNQFLFRSSNKQEVLAAAFKLMDELKKEREQGIANNRPTYYETGIAHREERKLFFESLNHPPLPTHIKQHRDDLLHEAILNAHPEREFFDPYSGVAELPLGGRNVGD